jgi:serine/threonine protein kinase
MSKFTYGSGARPLDGYVIKRGIGQGGFGEVYYAVSDGGKEVALKLVRGNHEIELRGMAQCLNLKHPNLVTLFDIRNDKEGDAWVVMEYVAGEALSEILHPHPNGLPLEMVRQIFSDLAKAVGYLHESGIVHRDLKPANIFVENGQVKVCDYGLSKSMSGSKKSAQTQSVGTVHYMAPEISTGNYGKQIDIYAAGIILYEMIAGRCPFDGETAGEILMKHLTATPDLSPLPVGWRALVAKALAKNPSERYANIREMAQDLEAAAPAGGPVAATAAFEHKPAVAPSPAPMPRSGPSYPPLVSASNGLEPLPWRDQVKSLSSSMLLSVVWAALAMIGWVAFDHHGTEPVALSSFVGNFLVVVASCWAVLIPAKVWDGHRNGDPWLRRSIMLICGIGIGLLAAALNPTTAILRESSVASWREPSRALAHYGFHACYFGLAFFAQRWWTLASRRRERRFSLFTVAWIGVVSALLTIPIADVGGPSHPLFPTGVIVMMLTAGIVQLVSPWTAPTRVLNRPRKLRYA